MVQCGAVWCSVAQCGTVWYSVVQCGTVWYIVTQCGTVWCRASGRGLLTLLTIALPGPIHYSMYIYIYTLYQLLNTNALNSKLLNSIVWCRRVLHFMTISYFAGLFYPVTEKQTETQVRLKLASETCQQSPLNYYCDITGHWYWSWYWHCYWYWSQRCSREWMKHVDIARLLLSHSLCVQPPKWIRLVVSR